MADDYQVLAFHDAAPLRQVGIYAQKPLTLDVRGKSFVGVSKVLINNVESPEFVVVSTTRILAQVPDSETNAQLRAVRVLLARTGLTKTSVVDLEAIVPGARAGGFNKLLQAFLRLLFTNPGEDIANPWAGGGLGKLVGAAGTPGELLGITASAIRTTEQQLIRLQTRNSVLTDAERLRSATLLQAEYDLASTSMAVRLTLTAMDGTTGNPLLNV